MKRCVVLMGVTRASAFPLLSPPPTRSLALSHNIIFRRRRRRRRLLLLWHVCGTLSWHSPNSGSRARKANLDHNTHAPCPFFFSLSLFLAVKTFRNYLRQPQFCKMLPCGSKLWHRGGVTLNWQRVSANLGDRNESVAGKMAGNDLWTPACTGCRTFLATWKVRRCW